MNSSAKNLLLEKARSLLLDAVGCMSCPIAPQLSEKLEKFLENEAPVKAIVFDYYKNFIPYFANVFSWIRSPLLLFSSLTGTPRKRMQISPFMHEPKIITTLSARILQKLSDIWKSSIPMKSSMRLPTHPPWQTAGSLTRQDSVFSARTTASSIRNTVLTLPSEPY